MSLLNVDTVEPEGATTDLTLGAGGDKVVIPGTIKISGGSPGADKVLTSDASGDATWVAGSSGGLLGLVVYTGDGTYTAGGTSNGTAGDEGNASVTKIIIECQAAGGGAADNGGDGGNYNGGGGGGAAYSKTFREVVAADAITIVVPSGGAGGAPGVAGGAASLTRSSGSAFATITCLGGGAGGSPSGTTNGTGGTGAAAPTTGDINVGGGEAAGGGSGHNAKSGGSFMGVQTYLGTITAVAGSAPVGYGSGGCAGSTGSGADGGAGLILIWEYA